ncbi:MAG: hypothetical protein ACI3VA_11000, partial [Candidatus Limivicinus sp.]
HQREPWAVDVTLIISCTQAENKFRFLEQIQGAFPNGTVSLSPLCVYSLTAKGVTTFVTPFAYFSVLRAIR